MAKLVSAVEFVHFLGIIVVSSLFCLEGGKSGGKPSLHPMSMGPAVARSKRMAKYISLTSLSFLAM